MSLTAWRSGIVPTNRTYRLSARLADLWAEAGRPVTLLATAGGAYDDPCICLASLGPLSVSCGRAGAIAIGARDIRQSGGQLTAVLQRYQIADLGAASGYRSNVASQLACTRATDAPPSGYSLTWWQAEPLARAGIPVRRLAWTDPGRTITFRAGAGSTRAVAIVTQTSLADTVVTPTLFAAAEFLATDWIAPSMDTLRQDISQMRLDLDLRTLDDDTGYGDPLAGNITWHLWTDAPQSMPANPADPGSPQPPPPGPANPEGFVYRRADGTEVIVPARRCDQSLWTPP